MPKFILGKPSNIPGPKPIYLSLEQDGDKVKLVADDGITRASVLALCEGSGMLYRHKGIATLFGFAPQGFHDQIKLTEGG